MAPGLELFHVGGAAGSGGVPAAQLAGPRLFHRAPFLQLRHNVTWPAAGTAQQVMCVRRSAAVEGEEIPTVGQPR